MTNLTIDQALLQAIEAHRAGRPHDAEQLYRAILEVQPQHPDANHNLGVLERSVSRFDEALLHFKKALDTHPEHAQFWLSYINALIDAGQLTRAQQALAEGKRQGLAAEAVALLAQRIAEADAIVSRSAEAPSILPSQLEIQTLLSNFNSGNWAEAESIAQEFVRNFPNYALSWKVLGVIYKTTGRIAESVGFMKAAVRIDPGDSEAHSNLGVTLQELGLFKEAEACYHEAIRLRPDYAEAHHNLGNLFKELKHYQEAAASYREAIRLKPNYAESHNNLGVTQEYLEHFADAEASYREAIRLKPEFAEAYSNLGNALKELGQLITAEDSYREAVRLRPDFAKAHCNLGAALHELERFDEAEASYREAIRLKPDYPEAHNNLGNTLKMLGNLAAAEASYREAIRINPELTEAHNNLGNVFKELGIFTEAQACYQEAIRLNPDFAIAHNNLGNIFKETGRLSDAEASYQQAINLKPDFAEAHSNLGNTLEERGKLAAAEASCRQAIRLKPEFAEAHSNLGNILEESGSYPEAEASYREAIRLKPLAVEHRYRLALLLPNIYDSVASIQKWRNRYRSGLLELLELEHAVANPANKIAANTFYLAYHNQCDLDFVKLRSSLVRKAVHNAQFVSPHVNTGGITLGKRIKIGFCSQFFVNHTIGKLYQGLIKHLDRSVFEVVVIHASGTKTDQFSDHLNHGADKVLRLPTIMTEQLKLISEEKLDVLFYPDIGMASETYYLAHARLAPVQVVSWGHPDTTGINTLDYFVSSSLIEPDNADQQYSERLIRITRLPCYYQPLIAPSQIPTREVMGLPENETLYGCPQNLIKLHPDFDAILAEIVTNDPNGRIILIEGKTEALSRLLRMRWAASYPILNERTLFLPKMPLDKFMALMAHIDVLLDPIHFGSGNTMYESNVYGTPTVTWQGEFMRGRIVAGAYKQLGIENPPIASRLGDYAQIAVELGKNPSKRNEIKTQILSAAEKSLYSDHQAIKDLEEFFIAAVDAAAKGEKLPIGWMPSELSSKTR